MSQRTWIAAVFILGVGTLTARTASAVEPGVYVGANAGWATINDKIDGLTINDGHFGWKVLAGYRLTTFFGLEGSYVDLGKMTDTLTTLHTTGWTAEVTGYLPFAEQLDAYGKVGAFFWDSKATAAGINADTNSTNITGGVGVLYSMGTNFGMTAEWQRYATDHPINLYSVGLQYRFF